MKKGSAPKQITPTTKPIEPSKSTAQPALKSNPISRLGAYAHPPKKKGVK